MDEVGLLISSLNPKKCTGADNSSAALLKATALVIAESLINLFNKALMTGKCPFDWELARIVPIPKSGDPEHPSNYRSISILSILSKLVEKQVQNLISLCLNNSTPLSQHQWGFTPGKSTTTA